MNKILKIFVVVILVSLIILVILIAGKYVSYNRIVSIVNNAKQQVSSINNVLIELNPSTDGKESENKAKIFIKDGMQCDTEDRKKNEEQELEYNVLNTKEKKEYRVESHFNDKKIYIYNNVNNNLYTVEVLDTLIIPEFSLKNKYEVTEDSVEDCYIIKISDKENEYTYWISKEIGLLVKQEIQANSNKKHNEQCIYKYTFDVVTDDDVKEINLAEYPDYKQIVEY